MTTLTPTQLAEIEARADAATKGPWIAAARGSIIVGWPVVASSGRTVCGVTYIQHSKIDPETQGDRAFNAESKRNAEFIAHARQDIPALLSHARALEAERDRLKADNERLRGGGVTALHAARDRIIKRADEHRDQPDLYEEYTAGLDDAANILRQDIDEMESSRDD